MVVTGWDQPRVKVTGTLGRDVEDLVVESRGGTIEISVEPHRGRDRKSSADLEIQVPEGSGLEIEVVSADVRVSGAGGDVAVEAVGGSIIVEGEPESVDAEAVSGNVLVTAAGAPISVETVSGDVKLKGVSGKLEVESVSGRIRVEGEDLKRAEINSVSSGIELMASLAHRAEVEIECHSGGVELTLPASTSARFEVETYSGRIDNELGPPALRVGRYTPQQELEFTLGDGDAKIQIDSFSGTVALRAQ